MSNVDGLKLMSKRIDDLFGVIEKQEGFLSSEGWLNGVIYDLYSKTKRSFQTTSCILESNIPNSYIETLPQLRIILESYLHSNYIRLNISRKDEVEQEYKDHLAFQQWRLGRTLNEYKESSVGSIHSSYESYIQEFFEEKPKLKRINHLESIKELANKTHNFGLYAEVYTILSGFLHYNPQTRKMYGSVEDDTFTFNKYEYDEKLDIRIRKQILTLTLNVIRNSVLYFGLFESVREDLVPIDKDMRFLNEHI